MKKLIFGNGKVPSVIKDSDTIVVPRTSCDVRNYNDIKSVVEKHGPSVVINCAAKTNLEFCEDNKTESYEVNTHGAINILRICSEKNIKFVHISSGCLFDGNHFVSTEETIPSPSVWYTYTKVWADEYIKNYGYENYLILRPRQLISALPHPTNMITKFSKFDKIQAIKEPNSITCIEDFSEMLSHLLNINARGVYNCCNDGVLSPHDIAISVRDNLNSGLEVVETTYENLLKFMPNRRVNTILSNEKLKSTGYTPRSATDALEWCVKNYNHEIFLQKK
jgi:dTDP-4-dehydrorhamnose reductase